MRQILAGALALLAAPAGAQTLLEELAETGRFDRFVAGVEAAGLAGELRGTVTVLVPTDAAYEALPIDRLEAAFEDDPALARRVLLTHIAPGAAHPADAMPATLSAASGETVSVRWTGGRLLVQVDGGTTPGEPAEIGGGEIRSGDGVAHPVTGLLLPQDASLAAILRGDPPVVAAEVEPAAVAEVEVEQEDAPIPEDGIFLDDVVEEPEVEAIVAAPVETDGAVPEGDGATVVTLAPTGEVGSDGPQVFTTAPEAAEEGVVAVEPSPVEKTAPAAAPEEAGPSGVEAGVEAGLQAARGLAGGDAPVIVEDLDVTVEAAPRVEPRTVAPSAMTGAPSPSGEGGGEAGGQRADTGSGAPDAGAGAEGGAPPEEILSATIVGWPVYGSEGEELGRVEHLVLVKETGAVEGMLVEVGGFLGTGLGGKLVRVEISEVRIDATDEAVVASLPGDEVTGRPGYEGPELDP